MGHAWHEITVSLFYNNVLNCAEFRRSKKETESEYNLCSSFVSLPCYDVLLWYPPQYNLQPNTISPGNMQPNTISPGNMQPKTISPRNIQPDTVFPGIYTLRNHLSRYVYNQLSSLQVYIQPDTVSPGIYVYVQRDTISPGKYETIYRLSRYMGIIQ